MSSDMKLIMESWRKKILQEQDTIQTVGQLKKVINLYRLKAVGKGTAKIAGGVVVDAAIDELTGKIPGLQAAFSLFGGAKDTVSMIKKYYSAEDNFKTNTGLDKLNIDDNVSKIVDDEIENAFLKALMDMLNGMNDSDEIPDVNQALQDYLKEKFNQHSVEAR